MESTIFLKNTASYPVLCSREYNNQTVFIMKHFYTYIYLKKYPTLFFIQKEYSEQDILALLPNKKMTLDIMVITKLLSKKGTNSLGEFEMQYMYDPVGVQAATE